MCFSLYILLLCFLLPYDIAGITITPRRSGRLKQLSLPRNTIREPIDLVESSDTESSKEELMADKQISQGKNWWFSDYIFAFVLVNLLDMKYLVVVNVVDEFYLK